MKNDQSIDSNRMLSMDQKASISQFASRKSRDLDLTLHSSALKVKMIFGFQVTELIIFWKLDENVDALFLE